MATSSAPRPTTNRTFPIQSILARLVVAISRRDLYAQTVPNSPNGTFTQNTRRQSQAASTPPSSSPANFPEIPAIWLTPSAMPRLFAGKASVKIAAEFAISIAPPNACTNRQPISHSAPPPHKLPTTHPHRTAPAGQRVERERDRGQREDDEAQVVDLHPAEHVTEPA